MKKRRTILMFLSMLFGFATLHVMARSAFDDRVCPQPTVDPTYPRLARLARITGAVDVDIEVDKDGSVRSAIGSGAHNLLNRAAEENVKKWTFCSSNENFKVKIIYAYRFEGQAEYQESPPKVVFHLPRVEIVPHPPMPGLD